MLSESQARSPESTCRSTCFRLRQPRTESAPKFSPSMFPILLTLLWDRQTKLAAILSPLAGMLFGIASWLGLAYHFSAVLEIESTGSSLPCMVRLRDTQVERN